MNFVEFRLYQTQNILTINDQYDGYFRNITIMISFTKIMCEAGDRFVWANIRFYVAFVYRTLLDEPFFFVKKYFLKRKRSNAALMCIALLF